MTYSLTTLTAHNNTNVRNTARSLLTLMWTSYGVKFDHLLTEMEPLPSDVLRIMSKDMELPSLSKVFSNIYYHCILYSISLVILEIPETL